MSSVLRAVIETVAPDAAALDEAGWREVEGLIESALRDRPESLQRQLRFFLAAIEWLPALRYGARFSELDAGRRARFLSALQDHPVQKIRVGFWGLRTMALLGFYGRPEAARAIGYRASAGGWDSRR